MALRFRLLTVLAAASTWLVQAALPAAARASARHLTVVLAPAEGDLALAELSFPHARGRALSQRSLRLAAPAFAGADYFAVATPARPLGRARVALALVANRPTGLLDPAFVRLRAVAGAGLGAVVVRRIEDPLKGHPSPPPWLCGLASHGAAPQLRALMARGSPIAGLDASGAVEQAFDIACGLPTGPQLEAALAPPGPQPVPEPGPPPPEAPRCPPCNPRPDYACPLAAAVVVCPARLEEGAPEGGVAGG